MENFLTWDILLTFSGCVAGTVFITEWMKKIFKSLPAQFISFGIAVAIIVCGHIATKTYIWNEVPLYLINAVAVSLSANGGFDILSHAFTKTVEAPRNDLVIDGNDTYLELEKEPEEYEEGEVVTFLVKKSGTDETQK